MNTKKITRTILYTLGIAALILLFGFMHKRDREPEAPQCPSRYGYELIGRGHMEIDGQRGELMCTYSTPPVYRDMVAGK